MITRKDILIARLQCATIINSPTHFFSYDHKAGEKSKPIQCIFSFMIFPEFTKELLSSGIVNVKIFNGFEKEGYSVFSFVLVPQFGYSNQKFEDIICQLFEKYKL